MFTSEPTLAQRIERMIGDTPIVDPFSRIRIAQPQASDLAALLMGEPAVRVELLAVGLPKRDLEPSLPADERVRRSLPYLKKIKNTTTAWSLSRIFRDLYEFDEPEITEANYRDLFDRVAKSANDPGHAGIVLRDRSKLQAVVTSDTDTARNSDDFDSRLDLSGLICPGTSSEEGPYFETMANILGDRPSTLEKLDRLIFDWLDRTLTGRVRFASVQLPIGNRLEAPDEAHAQFVLTQVADDWDASDVEVDWLAKSVTWSILRWLDENKKTLQIVVGPGDVPSSSKPREAWASDLARTFRHFPGARFALLAPSEALGHEAAFLTRQLPNVSAMGLHGPSFVPMLVEQDLRLRIQVAPMTKVGGFHSGAQTAEWTYGRLQIFRNALSAALARLVEGRFFEEDEVPPLLRHVLHDTPREIYDLGEK